MEKSGFPIYYNDFSCIADKCKNSCCIGWEIDVDEDTKELYGSLEGGYAEKIKESIITDEDGAHFKLCENGNCPHLSESGLCNIISEYGDGALCDICYLYPRFINSFSGYTETGLGLSCEEVSRIIINTEETFHIIAQSGFDEELAEEEKEIIEIREDIFTALNCRELKLSERLVYIGEEFGINVKKIKPEKLIDKFLSLERLDDNWTELLKSVKGKSFSFDFLDYNKTEISFEQIASYFVFRHFTKCLDDGDMQSKIKFSVTATMFLSFLLQGKDDKKLLEEYARMFSSEVEYSEENTNKLFEIL